MNPVYPPFINELRELEKKATPGEWAILGRNHEGEGTGIKCLSVPNATIAVPCTECLGMERENAKLIVALRNAFPDILALAEENERLRKIVEAGEEFDICVNEAMIAMDCPHNETCHEKDRDRCVRWTMEAKLKIAVHKFRKEGESLRRYREAKGGDITMNNPPGWEKDMERIIHGQHIVPMCQYKMNGESFCTCHIHLRNIVESIIKSAVREAKGV